MMTLSLFSGLALVGWALARVTSAYAPVGYEDESGFHYGPRAQQAPQRFSAPTEAYA
jgi:hypothetical protein